jgi:hypothetical protein
MLNSLRKIVDAQSDVGEASFENFVFLSLTFLEVNSKLPERFLLYKIEICWPLL